ncbi:AraC family transcriptional regulator [Mucilaginibacter yixingensis]|uniref:AraC family transcriptional regulator n=1 Tax=Mucilaginibacter yixingensis TaxID=1295612 RepID=A0A2T5JD86_9SPHI|nr:helix-turn-helix domain-containing protein [Mucilaginibacter yixingensis]PTQ99719.1 AraC family transcriptional regulator [Mucilaginibacter yixingensis]
MIHQYQDPQTGAQLRLVYDEPTFDRVFYGKDRKDKLLTIAWNRGAAQHVTIDNVAYIFPANALLCLMVNETFHFETPSTIVAWQFNRDFYCIVDHDQEVSCVGFLFYGTSQRFFINLNDALLHKFQLLLEVFKDEFQTADHVQGEMMRVILKRLIIIATRLAREQYVTEEELPGEKLEIVRKFNLLVENHYKTEHQVKFYAGKLFKSPKTLSNLFALYNHKTPQLVIHERVMMEAKRLMYYTDKTSKEIAYDLGFEDANHFGKFFKKHAGYTTSDFKKLLPTMTPYQQTA